MLAIFEAKKADLFQRQHWLRNIISGAIVGVVALPLSMAFAIASGAKPEQGLYTAIIAGLVVSIFGGRRVQIAGPTGAFIAVLSTITAQYGMDGLQIATLMAGCILLLLGLTKMGSAIKFIPDPVIVGFTAGIGIIIWVGQWKDFFGLPNIPGEHFHGKLWHLIQSLPQLHIPTTIIAVISLLMVIYSPHIPGFKRVPGPVVAWLVTTAISVMLDLEGVKTIGSTFGGLPQDLPHFKIPVISWNRIVELVGPAFTIAMLGAIESLLSAAVADGMAGTRHDSNQELIGQGLANLATPLFGGFAATGAIARTATNIRNGGTSPLSGIVHSITLLAILLFLAPLAAHIPLASLAAILFVIAWNMSEAKHFVKMVQRAPKADVAILLITFTLTIFADLVIAVNIGVILSILHFLRRMSASTEIRQLSQKEVADEIEDNNHDQLVKIVVFTVQGPFFFGAVENFERTLANTHTDPKVVIIHLKWVPFIDITGLQTLEEVINDLHQRNVSVALSGANDRVRQKLQKAGIFHLIGNDANFKTLSLALNAYRKEINKL